MTQTTLKNPKLRFKRPDGADYPKWNVKPLLTISSIYRGVTYRKSDERKQGKCILRSNNIDLSGTLNLTDVKYIDKEIKAHQKIIKDDIMICMSNGSKQHVGKVCLFRSDTSYYFGGFMGVIRSDKGIVTSEFLYYCMNTAKFKKFISDSMVGTNINNLNNEILSQIDIVIPILDEQQKIAVFLSAIDRRLALLQAKYDRLMDYKRGIMQQIFTQKIRFKKPNGTDYPKWQQKRLGDVGDIVGGGTPESGKVGYWNGNIIWYTPSELKHKFMSVSQRTISNLGLEKSSAKLLPVGTLLLSSRATIGDVAIATKECTTNQGFQSIIVKSNQYNEFWYYWIANNKKEFIRYASGSTFLEIGKKQIEKIKCLEPHPDEQKHIADFLSAIDYKIDTLNTQLTQTKQYKKSLMQRMFV